MLISDFNSADKVIFNVPSHLRSNFIYTTIKVLKKEKIEYLIM